MVSPVDLPLHLLLGGPTRATRLSVFELVLELPDLLIAEPDVFLGPVGLDVLPLDDQFLVLVHFLN